MYKAIKENKIIAINDSGDFPCLVYDIVEEDKEHTCEDYAQYNDEFILKKDIPAPTEEEQKENRARAYKEEVDPLMAEYNRKKTFNLFEEGEEEALLIEVEARVEEIKQRYPYPEGENESDSID